MHNSYAEQEEKVGKSLLYTYITFKIKDYIWQKASINTVHYYWEIVKNELRHLAIFGETYANIGK